MIACGGCFGFYLDSGEKREKRKMGKIRITYYGHACFEVSADGETVIFDPYETGSVPGLKLPADLEADAVFCSHDHRDHNAKELVRLSGRKLSGKISYITVPHDHHNGTRRGFSKITLWDIGGVQIAHLGDIGRLPTGEELDQLKRADILMIPCAGHFTISSMEAEEIIRHLKTPSLKILMHFRDGNQGYEVQEDIADVRKNIPELRRLEASSIEMDAGDIPEETITLLPEQTDS